MKKKKNIFIFLLSILLCGSALVNFFWKKGLVNHKFTPKKNLEEEILINTNAYKSHTLMTINRLTGRYYTKMTILGYTKDTETIIEQTGTCMKYEKAF